MTSKDRFQLPLVGVPGVAVTNRRAILKAGAGVAGASLMGYAPAVIGQVKRFSGVTLNVACWNSKYPVLLADYLPYGEVVTPWQNKPEVPVCRDEKDQIFLDLAAVGAAHWLVTGDRDLLDLGGQVRFQFIAPATAIEWLTSAEPSAS